MSAPKTAVRTLAQLTQQPGLYSDIHAYFTWILKGCSSRLFERQLEGPSLVGLAAPRQDVLGWDAVGRPGTFATLAQLWQALGPDTFATVTTAVSMGDQCVVRCSHRAVAASVVAVLCQLLPARCAVFRLAQEAHCEPHLCNLLALAGGASVPGEAEGILLGGPAPPVPSNDDLAAMQLAHAADNGVSAALADAARSSDVSSMGKGKNVSSGTADGDAAHRPDTSTRKSKQAGSEGRSSGEGNGASASTRSATAAVNVTEPGVRVILIDVDVAVTVTEDADAKDSRYRSGSSDKGSEGNDYRDDRDADFDDALSDAAHSWGSHSAPGSPLHQTPSVEGTGGRRTNIVNTNSKPEIILPVSLSLCLSLISPFCLFLTLVVPSSHSCLSSQRTTTGRDACRASATRPAPRAKLVRARNCHVPPAHTQRSRARAPSPRHA